MSHSPHSNIADCIYCIEEGNRLIIKIKEGVMVTRHALGSSLGIEPLLIRNLSDQLMCMVDVKIKECLASKGMEPNDAKIILSRDRNVFDSSDQFSLKVSHPECTVEVDEKLDEINIKAMFNGEQEMLNLASNLLNKARDAIMGQTKSNQDQTQCQNSTYTSKKL